MANSAKQAKAEEEPYRHNYEVVCVNEPSAEAALRAQPQMLGHTEEETARARREAAVGGGRAGGRGGDD